MAKEIRTVGLVGFGTMGIGIAQVCAAASLDVVAVETAEDRLAAGLERLTSFLDGGIERGKTSAEEKAAILARISSTTDLAQLANSDIVIEAVVEDHEVKAELFGRVAAVVAEDCIIATNTSALSVTELARTVSSPQRFGGLHFFNPVPLMELVEVIPALQTAPETVEALVELAGKIGKHPVPTKDRPGFLLNKLLMPYLNQVIQDYDDEIASASDIDAALRLGLGYPMGALEMLDMIGLDVHRHATEAAYEQNRDPAFAAPPLLSRMVAAGRLGKKSGRGFRVGEDSE
jgi:3-hydroxybutyryl-CoA dehydrogenase